MKGENEPVALAIFGVLIVLALVSNSIFFFSRNARLKRRLLGPIGFCTGLLLLAWTWLAGFPVTMLVFVALAVPAMILLNRRALRFCDACGRTVMSPTIIFPPEHCSNCGKSL